MPLIHLDFISSPYLKTGRNNSSIRDTKESLTSKAISLQWFTPIPHHGHPVLSHPSTSAIFVISQATLFTEVSLSEPLINYRCEPPSAHLSCEWSS